MPRTCFRFPRASLLAASLALAATGAAAQTAPDPLAPYLAPSRVAPQRFEQRAQVTPSQLAPPIGFTPSASGAGDTGYDSTNARKKLKAKPKKPAASQAATSATSASPQPAPLSRYQVPPPPLTPASNSSGANGAYAQAPGSVPPVDVLNPIRVSKKRKAHTEPEDPYAPLGVEAGSFLLYPAIEFIGGHDSNPGRTPGGTASWLYSVAPELKAQSNWSRHELKADLRGSYDGYSPDQTPSLNRPYFNGKVDGRIDVSHDTRIDLTARDIVSTDNPGSPNIQAGLAKLPLFTTFGGSAGVGQRFNRLELEIKGDVDRTIYQNSSLTDGTTASNEDRQFNQYGGRLRASYELTPGVKPFVEVSGDTRVHDLETDFSGFQRNSTGVTGKAGSTIELSRLLTGEIALGYTQRKYEDARLPDVHGLVGDASLIWTASALTTVKLSGSSAVGESTVPVVSGVLYRDVGLQVDHAFRSWLIGTCQDRFRPGRLCRHGSHRQPLFGGPRAHLQAQPQHADQGRGAAGMAALERHRRRLQRHHVPARGAVAGVAAGRRLGPVPCAFCAISGKICGCRVTGITAAPTNMVNNLTVVGDIEIAAILGLAPGSVPVVLNQPQLCAVGSPA